MNNISLKINYELISKLVSFVCYAGLLSGIILIFSKDILDFLAGNRIRKRLKKSVSEKGKAALYLEKLFGSVLMTDVDGESVIYFLSSLFVIAFAVSIRSFRFLPAVMISLMFTSLPVILAYIRLEDGRIKGSREGISMVSELFRQYRICDKNIYSAIEKSLSSNADFPIGKKQLYKLLLHLRESSADDEIKNSIESFCFSLGTIWGRMLGTCIRLSSEKGLDVSEGLADIIKQLKVAEKRTEERKRINAESARMTLFLIPAMFVGTMLLSVRYLGLSFSKYIKNQFFTAEGLLFFILIVFLFVVNIVLIRLVTNKKTDF